MRIVCVLTQMSWTTSYYPKNREYLLVNYCKYDETAGIAKITQYQGYEDQLLNVHIISVKIFPELSDKTAFNKVKAK